MFLGKMPERPCSKEAQATERQVIFFLQGKTGLGFFYSQWSKGNKFFIYFVFLEAEKIIPFSSL